MDADTGTTLTYAWSLPAIADGSVSPVNAATATYTPPTLATGDTARMIVITVTVSDDATPPLTATATHTVTVNPPVPTGTAPAFTNSVMFTSAIEAAENQSAAGVANFFASPGTAPVTLTLGGADAARFAITSGGTLTFADAPNFEMPRGMAFDASSNTNNYALTVTAMNAFGSAMSGAITVRVTDVNEAPVLPAITPPAFTEYTAGTFDITATDVDAGQTVSFTLNAPNHGATLTTGGTFVWTPGEDDGTVARTFSVTVTDSATTPMMTTGTFDITAMELANRAPTGATLTVAGGATSVTNPNTLGLSASATDPDTGDMLTYTWSSSATGDSFSPATGASTTWTPPTVTAATVVTLTVTITDSTDGSVTATQNVTVNPMVTAPTFTNTFTTPVTAAENQTAAGAANFFAATAIGGPVSYALTGADMAFFTLSSTGTLTFNDAPDFERPRGNPLTAGNTNNYALNIAATANGLTTNSPAFTVRVTDENEAPTITSPAAGTFTASTFTEYSAGTFNVVAADVDDGQTLTYALTAGAAFGAAINADSGAFTWTPREVDGGEERMFTIMVTDSGSPPMTATVTFSITPMELANRAPTGLTITAPTPVTNPATPTVAASATDPDTDMLTYTWSSSAGGDTFNPTTGASVTWTPATVMTATTVTLTVVVTDGEGGSVTSTQDVLVNPAATIPVFANPDDVAFMVVEGTTMAGAANQFSATGTGVVTLTLGGTDAGLFTLTSGGTLTFNAAPDFEMPRGMAFDAGSNTNSYPLTVTATASGLTGSMSFTVTVTDENEAPVLAAIVPAAFTEYMAGTFAITATDVDAGQTLSYALTGATHGATLTTGGTFTWTPGEDDGGMARTFSVTVTDTGTPPMMATGTFDITAAELANRAPTGATITAAAMLTSPNPITLAASAMDADTGTTLTYTWAVTTTEGGTIAPVMGASATYTPPTLATGDTARMIVITLTVSDDATTPLTATATHTVTVNPPVAAGTAPAFTNMAMFTTAIEAAENQSAAAAANFFAAPGSGTVALTLGGADVTRFAITAGGTLTFADAPNFEMPRGIALSGSNTNNYALTVTAMNAFGSAMSGAITVTVTDENEAPVLSAIPTPTFTEYTAGGFTITATDVDRPAQTLAFALTGETHGATLTAAGGFSWTPREMDGTVARTFNVMVTDSGTPPQMASTTFAITAVELANRAPTGVMITNTETTIQNPATLTVSATASDPDTGDMLTYTWSASAGGGTFDSATGASVVWTPPDVTAATTYTLTVTVSDGTAMATDMHDIIVQPVPDIAPAFAIGESIPDQVYIVDMAIMPVTLPAVETEGNGATMYTLLTPPTGLTFDADTRILSGTPTVVRTTTAATYTARDSDMNNDLTDIATLTVSFTVNAMPVPDTAPAFAIGESIPDQVYIVDMAIAPVTLPAVETEGNGATMYTLLTPPTGLTFDADTRILSGTPTVVRTTTAATYTARDSDMNNDLTDIATLTVSFTVNAMPAPDITPVFTNPNLAAFEPGGMPLAYEVAENTRAVNVANFFAATMGAGGEPAMVTLSGADASFFSIADGTLTFNTAPDFEMPRGMPFDSGNNNNDYLLTLTANPMVDIIVRVVTGDTAPSFGDATTPAQTYIAGLAIEPLTLPAATGGNGAITYTLTPAIPGLTLDAATGVLTGTPTTVAVATMYTYTAGDTDGTTGSGDEDTLMFSITVEANTVPAFSVTSITNQSYLADSVITPLTLPLATGGNGAPITYSLVGALPAGLTFDGAASPPTITGTPTTPAAATVVYAANDGDSDMTLTDEVTLTFTITIIADTAPAFAVPSIPDRFFFLNEVVALTLPAATNGNGASTYTLTPTLPAGLTFNATARTITGTASTPATAQTFTYTALDTDADTATLTINIGVDTMMDTAPDFGTATTPHVPSETIAQNRMITLTLPEATGGNGAIIYMLAALPAGLTFDAATRVITGTPEAIVAEMDYTYTAADSDGSTGAGDEDTLIVRFEVIQTPPIEIRLSVDPAAVTESTAATTITVTATLIDGSFAAERNITVASTDGTATVGTDYTAVPDTILTIPANATSGSATFMFTAGVDTVDEPSGETVSIGRSVTTGTGAVGSEIPVTPATLTINDYTRVTVNAGADRSVGYGDTITLNGRVPPSFTDVTAVWALSNRADALTALVEAELTMAQAQAELTRLTDALALITTPRGTLTAPTADPQLTGPVPLIFTLTVTDNAAPAGQLESATMAMDTVTITVEENTTALTTALNQIILPEVARAMADITTSSIARRIEQATTDTEAATLTLNGRALSLTTLARAGSFADALNSPGVAETLTAAARGLSDGSWQPAQLFGNSSFVLPLNADGALGSRLMLWGHGDYRNVSGKSGGLDWDGDLISGRLGVDAKVTDTLLAGLAISRQSGDFDYTGAFDSTDTMRGTYNIDQTSIHPYLGWSAPDGRADAWITLGYGLGEVEIEDEDVDGSQTADLTTRTIGGGGSATMVESGMGTLRLKGEILQTRADVDGNADAIAEMSVDARRMRLTVEGARELALANGASLRPTVEVGLRHDAGDGRTGTGAEIGGSLRFTHPAQRLMLEGQWRILVAHSGDYGDWGVSGTVRFEPGANGQGLAVSLQPSYGATASRVAALWAQETAVGTTASAATPRDGQMNVTISYGMDWADGMLTPYSRLLLTDTQTQAYRIGSRLQMSDGLAFDLEGLRQQTAAQPVDHGILLKLQLDW